MVDRVELRGVVADDELQLLYQQSVLCLYLSLQEGFGYIPFEAASHGCPSLVANTSVYSTAPKSVAVAPYSCDETRQILISLLKSQEQQAANLCYWQARLRADHQRKHAAELQSCYQKVLEKPRNLQLSFWTDFIESNLLSGSSLVAYQSSFSESVQQLVRRGFVGLKRRSRRIFQRVMPQ